MANYGQSTMGIHGAFGPSATQVAAGRIPNVEGLGLEAAGVQCSPAGVKVNDDLTTSNPDILAIGDVTGR